MEEDGRLLVPGSVRHAKEDLHLQSQREGIAGARGVRKEEWGF